MKDPTPVAGITLGLNWTTYNGSGVTFSAPSSGGVAPAYFCQTCERWYVCINPMVSCCVVHGPEDCCHYSDRRATPDEVGLAEAALAERARAWIEAKKWRPGRFLKRLTHAAVRNFRELGQGQL